MDVLPAPVRPTIPTFSPPVMENDLGNISISLYADASILTRLSVQVVDSICMPSRRFQNVSRPAPARPHQAELR